MNTKLIASLLLYAVSASACGKLTIKVNKDAKNSSLASSQKENKDGNSFSLANPEDFLKSIDDLRTTAAAQIIQKIASKDYVSEFRKGVRTYRNFLIAKSQQKTTITDSFYENKSEICRSIERKLSLNIDADNQLLGMILQTVILTTIGEQANQLNPELPNQITKLQSNLALDDKAAAKALFEFLQLELGVEIKGSTTSSTEGDLAVTAGKVSLKLKPIAGEAISEEEKKNDEIQVLEMSFTRKLGKEQVGSFEANILLPVTSSSKASAVFKISREKQEDHFKHVANVRMGLDIALPSYSREIRVSDIPYKKLQFKFTEVLNLGGDHESINPTIVTASASKITQCKITDKGELDPDDVVTTTTLPESNTISETTSTTAVSSGSGSGSSSSSTTSTTVPSSVTTTTRPTNPANTPNQSPTQSPGK